MKKIYVRRYIYISLFLFLLTIPIFKLSNDTKSNISTSVAKESVNKNTKSTTGIQATELTTELVKKGVPLGIKKEIAQTRKQKLKQLMKENPHEMLKISLGKNAREQIEPEIKEFIEEEISIDGALEILHADDFENKVAKHIYFFKTNQNKQYILHLTKPIDDLKFGTRVKIKGVRIDDDIAVDSRQATNFQTSSTEVKGVTTSKIKKVAYVLVSFQNTPTLPYTPDYAREVAFTKTQSVKSYYNEASFGSWDMQGHTRVDGDIFGWYTIPYDNTNCTGQFGTWTSAAEQQVLASGNNLNNYERVIIAFNNAQGCPGGGWTYMGYSKAWLAGGFTFRTIVHELGHTYGLHHASSRECYDSADKRVSLSNKCTDKEYGDPYDIMGTSVANHFSNIHKGTIGWYESSNTKTVTESGKYAIAPLGPNTVNTQALRVPIDSFNVNGPFYYVEYRQPYGLFDNFASTAYVVSGVSIRIGDNYSGTKTYLLDMTPNGDFYNSVLTVGQVFNGAFNAVKVTLDSINPSEAIVSVLVQPSECIRRSPEVSATPLNVSKNAGEQAFYQVFIKNVNSAACGASQFTFYSTVPSGWTHNPWSEAVILNPGATYVLTHTVTSPASAAPGVYAVSQEVAASADLSLSTRISTNYTVIGTSVSPTPTLSPTPRPTATPTPTTFPSPTPTPAVDITPPTVTITNPSNGAIVERKSIISIKANASDRSGISKVQFFVNNTLLCSDTVSPYSCNWTVPNQGSVTYALKAKAFDTRTNFASRSISVKSSSCFLFC